MSVIFKTLCLFTVGASQRVCLFSLFFFSVSLFSSHVSPLLVWSSDPVADRVSLTHSLFLPLSLFSSFVWLRASLSRPLFSLIPSSLLFLLSLLSLSRAGGVWLSSKPWATEPETKARRTSNSLPLEVSSRGRLKTAILTLASEIWRFGWVEIGWWGGG